MSGQENSGPDAIYHEVSPAIKSFGYVYGIVTIGMIGLAILFCFMEGSRDGSYYLLAVNLSISLIILIFLSWWYRSGSLLAGKIWFLFFVATIIIFQCITTDIYVFVHKQYVAGATVSPARTKMITPATIRPPPGNLGF